MNRGRRGEKVFESKNDYECFINVLLEAVELFALRISAFCLMPNHYHLLVQTPDANLSRGMRHINGVYTQRFNKAHAFDGQLFRGRYKAIVVEEENYLLQLVRYIHRNPVRAKIVAKPEDYQWSSHKGYLSGTKKWDWLHKSVILSMLATDPGSQARTYRAFMGEAEDQALLQTLDLKKWPAILGDKKFIEQLKEKFFEEKQHADIPDSKRLAPEIAQIKQVVCKAYNIDEDKLYYSKRAFFNEPRAMGMFLTRQICGESLKTIGEHFKIDSYSTVSTVIYRFKQRLSHDPDLSKKMALIRQSIMSQGET